MENVVFRTSGIIDLRALTVFGCSAKPRTSSPIGYFGTGLKYAIAVLAREGIPVTIYRGMDAPLEVKCIDSDFRGTTFSSIFLGDNQLPFTTELGKNWKLWQALRELESNTRDEDGSSYINCGDVIPEAGVTKIVVHGEAFREEYDNLSDVFFDAYRVGELENISDTRGIEIYDVPSEHLYYNGIRVYTYNRPAKLTYNIITPIALTEDRTIQYWFQAEKLIAGALAELEKDDVLDRVLSEDSSVESNIDFSDNYNEAKPSDNFVVKVADLVSSGRLSNTTARDLCTPPEPEEEEQDDTETTLDDLITEIFEAICPYIEEPAGYGAGYGFRPEAYTEARSIIQGFLGKKCNHVL